MGNLRSYLRKLSADDITKAVKDYEQKHVEKLDGDGAARAGEGEDRLNDEGLPYATKVPDGVKYLAGLMHSTHERVEQNRGEISDPAEGDTPDNPDPGDQAEGRD